MATKQYRAEMAAWKRRKARIFRMLGTGVNMGDVGRALGITRQRVRQIVKGKRQ